MCLCKSYAPCFDKRWHYRDSFIWEVISFDPFVLGWKNHGVFIFLSLDYYLSLSRHQHALHLLLHPSFFLFSVKSMIMKRIWGKHSRNVIIFEPIPGDILNTVIKAIIHSKEAATGVHGKIVSELMVTHTEDNHDNRLYTWLIKLFQPDRPLFVWVFPH